MPTDSSRPHRKIALRRMDGAALQLARAIGAGLVWECGADDAEWRGFELCLVHADAPAAAAPRILLRSAHGALQLDGFSLLQIGSGIALEADWPAPLLQDMAQLAWASLSPALRQALGGDADCLAGEAALPDSVPLLLTLVGRDGARHSCTVRAAPVHALAWLAQAPWRAQPSGPLAAPLALLPCPGQLWLGQTELPRSALSALRTGDAIRIALPYLGPDGPVRLRLGRAYLNTTVGPDGSLHFDSWGASSQMDYDSTQFLADAGASAAGALDEVPIRLDFTAGHTEMTLGQLRALASGSVITLAMPARPAVDILANGRRIGQGELIDVDGTLAVAISALEGGHE